MGRWSEPVNGDDLERQRFAIAPDGLGRAYALCRLLIFVVLCVAASTLANNAYLHRQIHTVEGHWFLSMAIIGIAAVILIFVMARASGRPFGSLGYAGKKGGRNFAIGLAAGIGLIAAQLGVLGLLGFMDWGTPTGASALYYAVFYALFFLVLAFTEESLFRGYTLVELSRLFSFWPAAALLAGLFGAIHAMKGDGESLAGGMQPAVFALIMAWSFRRTGTLWLAIGFHAGWDYAQSFIFGVPDSGSILPGSLFHPSVKGPDWITGGSIGPEGSVLAVVGMLAFATIVWALPAKQASRPKTP
jgi:uncharacterized protein